MSSSVIVGGARTPVGRFRGGLADVPVVDLGAVAIGSALQKSGVDPVAVDYVIMGQVLPAGTGQMPARQAAVKAGILMSTPALNINKMCLSGLQAIILADQLIRSGSCDVVVAGGMESMSRAPHLLPGSRSGIRYGEASLVDHMEFDGLHDVFTGQPMGLLTETVNDDNSVTRAEQDAYALRSHQQADKAWRDGLFVDEVVAVQAPGRRGATVAVERDEGVRSDVSLEALAGLPPAFRAGGTITAGNASTINDGACAVVMMSRERADRENLPWLAEVGAHGMVAGPDSGLQLQPSRAIEVACKRDRLNVADLDLVEINEAFAAVAVASTRDLGIEPERVNVNGGAVAMGHPVGMSGARIALHLALELRRRGGGVGAAGICGGTGQGDALILRVP
ncbi:acetyl-CoA C-acetyltransferase [Mycolicibacterium farcinogenes]|uniref:acetyl-CoA C-acetyltransferase n=1 Tax=Mycolicibacterium farcinogenes TaxID=1802 RepID=UPI001C8E8261|nr:acetyl-CoA C-acetyltransferase [Mycolicibacterium farcinogenes]QZH60918.1 acetyl-CoA C-acetyltransferase [Mycolicibacterium farcinogenes]